MHPFAPKAHPAARLFILHKFFVHNFIFFHKLAKNHLTSARTLAILFVQRAKSSNQTKGVIPMYSDSIENHCYAHRIPQTLATAR